MTAVASTLVIITSLLLNKTPTIPKIQCPQNDCTELVQSYLDKGGNITIPPGIYNIKADVNTPHQGGVYVHDNSTVDGKGKVILKAIPTSTGTYKILNIYAENTTVKNLEVVGDRYYHLGDWGEWGTGIRIAASHNVKLKNIRVRDCWGDGIYFGDVPAYRNDGIILNNITSLNNRRQGISLTSGSNITIKNSILRGTNGTAPQAGIDIEPNEDSDKIDNVNIYNTIIDGNHGAGILIYDHVNVVSNVNVYNTKITNNGNSGFYTLNGTNLTIEKSIIKNNQVTSKKYPSEIKLEQSKNVVLKNNFINSSVPYSHGISIYGGYGEISENEIDVLGTSIKQQNCDYYIHDNY